MRGVGGIQGDLSAGSDLVDAFVEYVRWCEERKRRMLMIVIIPDEELLTPRASVSGRAKAVWVVGLVLKRLELGF